MSININDYVYVPCRGVYGRVDDISKVLSDVYYKVTINGTCYEQALLYEDELVKLEVPDFKEGDIVTGLKGANAYGVTTEMAIMEVLRVEGDSMKVKILSHETSPRSVGFIYTVEPIWFKLARPRTNFYRGEKED